ncbi:MAG TPA: PP0621 family protein [Gammaproteobacteria bacterium]|nr:PP0621 family protein [Gammaproteobacteria bacterium]
MVRLYLLFLMVALLYAVLRLVLPARRPPAAAPPSTAATSKLVSCAHCGLRVPEGEAVQRGGQYYCDPSHAPDGRGESSA